MPDKTPDVWAALFAYLHQNYNAITGFVMAFFMSMLRGFFYNKKLPFASGCLMARFAAHLHCRLCHY